MTLSQEERQTMDAIAAEDASMRTMLRNWSEINSGSHNPAGLARMYEALAGEFATLGEVKALPVGEDADQPGKQALSLRCRPEAPARILMSGHMDTVFGINSSFQRCEELGDDKLRGPGLTDMKGGLVIMLKTLQAFENWAGKERVGWEVLITPDEEIGSAGSVELIEAAAARNTHGFIFESALKGGLVRARMGVAAYAAVVHGKAAHTGRDFASGRNAVVEAARLAVAIDELNNEFPDCIFNVGNITGGGPSNVVPDRAEMEINVRVRRAEDMQPVDDRLRELAQAAGAKDGYAVEWTGGFTRPPREINQATEALFADYRECASSLGYGPVQWGDTGGASDGNLLSAAGLPCLDGMGAVGGEIHSSREWVYLSSLVPRAQIACLLLMRMARS